MSVFRSTRSTSRDFAHLLIDEERQRQDAKWGDQSGHSDEKWLAILVEEVGEVSQAILQQYDRHKLLAELGQVAAVAVAWMEAAWERKNDRL